MDKTDEMILDLLRNDGRISYQELGDRIGMSRVAAKKRVRKLEEEGVIRGYSARICREDEYTALMDIVTTPEGFDKVLRYISERRELVRQIFRTTKKDHLHIVAVSHEVADLKKLLRMIRKACRAEIREITCHGVKERIMDFYGGIENEGNKHSVDAGDRESGGGGDPS